MNLDPPLFHGPALSGGSAWPITAIADAPSAEPLVHDIRGVSGALGALLPGELWVVSGPPGVGASELALRIAVGAASRGTVIWANGHHPARPLARRVMELDPGAGAIALTSWLRAPRAGEVWESLWVGADLVMLDTWDEMWRPAAWSASAEERLADLRWMREQARLHETAVVLTAREDSRGEHWCRDQFDDVADVAVRIAWPESGRTRTVEVRRRGQGSRRGFLQPPR